MKETIKGFRRPRQWSNMQDAYSDDGWTCPHCQAEIDSEKDQEAQYNLLTMREAAVQCPQCQEVFTVSAQVTIKYYSSKGVPNEPN